MSRLKPLPIAELPEFKDIADATMKRIGFISNTIAIMARRPEIARAFAAFAAAVHGPTSTLDKATRSMIAQIVSRTAGCQYCLAHNVHWGMEAGLSPEKEMALWEYETSPLFSEAERAALSFAQASATVPNAVTDQDFVELKKYYRDEQIVDILAVACLYGFFNRWNDSLAAELEEGPLATAEKYLAPRGWSAGKHAPAKAGSG